MKPGVPWSVKGTEPKARAGADGAVRRTRLTLGERLNGEILNQTGNIVNSQLAQFIEPKEKFLSSTPHDPTGPLQPEAAPRDEQLRPAAPARRDESAIRLQDIAKQLSDLAHRERQHTSARAAGPARAQAPDEEALARVLERIDDNERQTVEAFTAVNDRLTVLGRQFATLPRADAFTRPEDVPGYSALEAAIRNVVEHLEVSEKRTRESLKAMQDRLGEIAEEAATQPRTDDVQRTSPILAGLEARVTELSNRLLRTESSLQAGMPDHIRREFGQLSERIDSVKLTAEQLTRQTQTVAASAVRSEIKEVETRLLATLKEAQATAGAPDFRQIRTEMGGLSRRMDEIKASSATERDLHALKLAVEHLSNRPTPEPDLRPLADIDRRLGEFGRKLEQVSASTIGAGQIRDIEARLADLGKHIEQSVNSHADPGVLQALEQNIAAIDERVTRTEDQLRHIETMEQAIRQLYDSLEQSRDTAGQVAEDAATRTVERMLTSMPAGGRSPELRALEEGLRAVRESAATADRRNQETLSAVHETLSQIVEKIAELEQAAPAAAYAPPPPQPHAFAHEQPAPARSFAPEPMAAEQPRPEPRPESATASASSAGSATLGAADDFIAAARRAAHAAASRPSTLRAEFSPVVAPAPEEGGLAMLRRFHKRAKPDDTLTTETDPLRRPVMGKDAAAKRKRLLYAALAVLTAVSAMAYFTLGRSSAPPPPAPIIEQSPAPAPPVEGPGKQSLGDLPVGTNMTEVVPVDSAVQSASLPMPATGTDALRAAAVNGDAAAQFIVAGRYLDGDDVDADPAQAAFWYEQAAVGGLAPAQYRLGTLLERGTGVTQDVALALTWYERAADQGNVKAMHNAAVISVGGAAGPADHAKAFRLFSAAADLGLRDSQFNVAILMERGLGTKPDKAEAVFWYRLAGLQGDDTADKRAKVLEAALTAAQRTAIDARVAAWQPQPSDDSANVVAVIDPAWKDLDTSVLTSSAAVPLAPGPSTEDLVSEAQHLLLTLGFNVGEPDGKLGSRTVAALRRFQAESGLDVTGELTPEVLDAMRQKAG